MVQHTKRFTMPTLRSIFHTGFSLAFTFMFFLFYGSPGYPEQATFENGLVGLNPIENELTYHIPGTIHFRNIMSNNRESFLEVSGVLDEDDPLEEFVSYLRDPVNWDPTQFIERRFIYEANMGWQQQHIAEGENHAIQVGLETHAEEALVNYFSPTKLRIRQDTSHLNLTDIRYAPYMTWRLTPRDWISLKGDARVNFLHFDIHNVCRTTCSLQANRVSQTVIPSFQGNLIVRPFQNTELFMNIGTGYHSFEDREPIGSTVTEQLTQTVSYQIGTRIQFREGFEVLASVWHVDLGSERVFLEDGDQVLNTGSSIRQGMSLKTRLRIFEVFSISGGWGFFQSTFNQTGRKIPLAPSFMADSTVTGQWGEGWTSSFHLQHIGQRTDSENQNITLPAFTTFDFTTSYQFDDLSHTNTVDLMFGILNLTNRTGGYTQFNFDSQLGAEYAQVFNLSYFPGRSRTIIGGITWKF